MTPDPHAPLIFTVSNVDSSNQPFFQPASLFTQLPDHFVDWMGTFMVILILLSPRRFMILRRLPVVFSGLNLLRSFTVIMTSLPDASPECAKQFVRAGKGTSYKDRNFEEAVVKSFQRAWLLIIQPGKHITCGDMVFRYGQF